jgi:NAD(P)-dependent dehydrogenase (short-subunit alcohol dehydrogenase family)
LLLVRSPTIHFRRRTREQARTAPPGHIGTPDDIASVTTFLPSDDERYMTGQTVVVDGGFLA